MTFDEYFKITRFKNRKSFNRPSLLFGLVGSHSLNIDHNVHQEMVSVL